MITVVDAMSSSWITGARRANFPPNLKIYGDLTAQVEILEEPVTQNFGKKSLRDGTEVDDDRARCRVTYLAGTGRSKRRDEPELPAKIGDEYTLWLASTLKGAMLDHLGWVSGSPPPIITGTKWNIWRGEAGQGGQRIYECDLMSGDYVAPDPSEIAKMDEDQLMLQLKDVIDKLGSIDKTAWYSFARDKGAEDPEAVTQKMAEAGYLTIESTKITAIAE